MNGALALPMISDFRWFSIMITNVIEVGQAIATGTWATETRAAAGAQVDIWHRNAESVYSAEEVEDTSGLTWLRGYQLTDSAGQGTFTTLFPGWYAGRTTHIHLRVRSKYSEASSTSDGTNTTQVFFPQATLDTINTTIAPYSSYGTNSTTNATDRVYADQTDGKMQLTLAGDTTSGYVTSVTINLPITAST
jgi:protocatechuate 3,4-dioxygenase beta subunit